MDILIVEPRGPSLRIDHPSMHADDGQVDQLGLIGTQGGILGHVREYLALRHGTRTV